ncbi:hypothetical protein [Rhodovibrio sodomensis]|nr:hypothetical protein [Rhodovibrio sodomensis]
MNIANPEWTAPQIAAAMGLQRELVFTYAWKYGIELPKAKPGTKADPARTRAIRRMLQRTTLTHREIAERVGCRQHHVREAVRSAKKRGEDLSTDARYRLVAMQSVKGKRNVRIDHGHRDRRT